MNDLAHDIRRYIDDAAPPLTLDEVRGRHDPHPRPRPRPARTRILAAGLVVLVVIVGTGLLVTAGPRSAPLHRPTTAGPPSKTPTPSTTPPVVTVPSAPLNRPEAMAMAPDGSLLIANQGTNQILSRSPDGRFSVVAGNGTQGFSGDDGPAVDAELDQPNGIAVASDGTIYIADTGNNRIRAISPAGLITTVAGDGTYGDTPSAGPATGAELSSPQAVAIGPHGYLYIGDVGIQALDSDGKLIAVYGEDAQPIGGTVKFFAPNALAFDGDGNLYVSNGSPRDLFEFEPDGTTADLGPYITPGGLVTAPDGAVIAGNYGYFAVDTILDGKITPLATFHLNSIPGLTGTFRPSGVAVAADGEVYADTDGTNGGTDTPALIAIDPDGHVHLLDSGIGAGAVVGVFDGTGNTVTRHGGIPSAGRLTLTDGPVSYRTEARSNGVFSVTVPAGIYRVTGRDLGQSGGVSSCLDPRVRVVARHVTRITVTCVFH
jgi:sugar lactone lactonase YvrE